MGVTKNIQSFEALQAIVNGALQGVTLKSATELTDGLCNAAYLLTLSDGREAIIKIAPGDCSALLSHEKDMMAAEVAAMRFVAEHTDIPVAKVYCYDDSLAFCNSPCLIMERLPGVSYYRVKGDMPKREVDDIDQASGEIVKRLSGITNARFGPLGTPSLWTDDLFSTVYRRMADVLSDGERKCVPIGYATDKILQRLLRDKEAFGSVTVPTLTHFDLWDGNILVQDGRITGIIDWERAIWAEPLMEDRFRRHCVNEIILKGAGIQSLTPDEKRRMLWYDVYLYLTMMIEGSYREYEDDSQYRWVQPLFEKSYGEILST